MEAVQTPESLPRRRFIAGAAATASAAWIAPSVLRVDRVAAATATCVPTSVTWTDYSFNLNRIPQESTTIVAGTTGIDLTAVQLGGPSPAGYGPVRPSSGQRGGQFGYLQMSLDNITPIGGYVDLKMDFSVPVSDLSFTFLDIDAFWNDFRDELIVTGTGPSGAVGHTFTTPAISVVTGSGTSASPFTGNCRTLPENRPNCSAADVLNFEDLGNVTVTMSAPVTSITIRYRGGDPPGPRGLDGQVVGISNMSFCAPPASNKIQGAPGEIGFRSLDDGAADSPGRGAAGVDAHD